MAESVGGSVTGPNGERLEVRLSEHKTLAVIVKDLVPLLLLVAVIVLGYLRSVALAHQLDQLYTRQGEILTLLRANRELLTEYRHELLERQQNQLTTLQQMLRTHEANRDRAPAERLPLDIPHPPPR